MERSTRSTPPRRRRIAIGVGTVVLLAAILALVGTGLRWQQGDTVLAGVSVAGEPVGGSSRDELVTVVAELAADRREARVTVVAGDED